MPHSPVLSPSAEQILRPAYFIPTHTAAIVPCATALTWNVTSHWELETPRWGHPSRNWHAYPV